MPAAVTSGRRLILPRVLGADRTILDLNAGPERNSSGRVETCAQISRQILHIWVTLAARLHQAAGEQRQV